MLDIMIDPGHGGLDPGAIGPTDLKEKDVNLKIALKLGAILKQQGVSIAYTRTTDTLLGKDSYSDLRERVRIANRDNPQYFLSLHCDSLNSSSKGVGTFIVGKGGKAELLANRIQAQLVSATKLVDRGVRTENFHVLKYTNMPAVLIEYAFLSNPDEEALLGQDKFQSLVAEATARGIIDYIGRPWLITQDVAKEAWNWGSKNGLIKDNNPNTVLTQGEVVEMLYKAILRPPETILGYTKYILDGALVVEVDPLLLKCRDMVKKDGKALSKEYTNFTNANFFLYNADGSIKKSIGWLISEGKILASRYEYIDFPGWAGNPKGTLIVYKDGTVEVGWKWDRDIALSPRLKDIGFCIQGFNLYPPHMGVKTGMLSEGWSYEDVGYPTNRISYGYNKSTKKVIIVIEKNSDAEHAVLTMGKVGCQDSAISMDSGLSTNGQVDNDPYILTDQTLASIVYW